MRTLVKFQEHHKTQILANIHIEVTGHILHIWNETFFLFLIILHLAWSRQLVGRDSNLWHLNIKLKNVSMMLTMLC